MNGFKLQRLGMIMEPEPGNPHEVGGVLNPGAVRGPDGELYLFPRLVAKGNYSRIGIARVRFNDAGDPAGVERLGIALEPEAGYELRTGGGGCEDPRVTLVEPLKRYIMTYTAFSPLGPRIAMAESEDLFHWKRLGLATYAHWHGIELGNVDDKDASLFPVAIPDSTGRLELGMLHRPLFAGTRPKETARHPGMRDVDLDRESIWISYCPPALKSRAPDQLGKFTSHHRLATPVSPWERLKIGAGTPPILTKHGWLIVYHGVSELPVTEWRSFSVLLGRSDGALKAASSPNSLSLGSAGVDADASRGTRWSRCQCRFPHGHRPARRSWNSRSFRRLLRHGGQSDWCGAP
jgi:predicted GH43/DUF377 family glycosyl hydrolase